MGKRRHARELALKVLFHMEFNPGDPAECFDLVWGNFGLSREIQPFSRQVVLGVWENKEYLDGVIREASQHWRLERMSLVDRNILRIALFEVLFMKDVPHKVKPCDDKDVKKDGSQTKWDGSNHEPTHHPQRI